jgi:hypothetical protein
MPAVAADTARASIAADLMLPDASATPETVRSNACANCVRAALIATELIATPRTDASVMDAVAVELAPIPIEIFALVSV